MKTLSSEVDKPFFRTGKRGRTVPIIIPPFQVKCIGLLEKCRIVCGVRQENKYFFALSGVPGFTRGWDAIKRYVNMCQERLTIPQALTGTQLRKQVSNISCL